MQLARPKREKMRAYSKHKILPSLFVYLFSWYVYFPFVYMSLHFWFRFEFLQKHCTCLQYLLDKWFFFFAAIYFFLFSEFTLSTYPPLSFVTPPIFRVTVILPQFALSKFSCLGIRWICFGRGKEMPWPPPPPQEKKGGKNTLLGFLTISIFLHFLGGIIFVFILFSFQYINEKMELD